jgi:staphylococcal nuclease domain-containing protein 1
MYKPFFLHSALISQAFGFESRNFLIQHVLGKEVQFRVLYTIPTGAQRDYGIINTKDSKMFPEECLAEGWLTLRDDASRRGNEDDYARGVLDKLEAAESKGKKEKKGMHSGASGKVEVAQEVDGKQFAEKYKGQKLEAVAERVLTGDRLILRLLISPEHHTQTMALIAGIRAPSTARTNPSDGKPQPAEPFGEDAQLFLESRILHRTLDVEVVGTTPSGQLVCTVTHKLGGDMATHMLTNGLARCMDQHSTMLSGNMVKLRSAEKDARDNHRRLWQDHVAPKASGNESEVTVVRVQTADTIFVRSRTGAERRINFSSIRQPKPTDPAQAPFQAEGKEYLRKRLIGKHVKLTIDGKKPATEGYEERDVATVSHGGKNVGLALVEAGYASVIRHRHDDTDRSPFYDDLLAAEGKAQSEKKGMWSGKPQAAKQYVDYSESLQKAKIQASVLQRQKRIPGIVDFVKGPSRFTVLIPRENAKITLVLSCIRAPRSARNPTEASEPMGQEAHEFANRKCNQRDVEIDVEGTDKVGGFIGTLYINRENFSKLLVEEGMASVHAYSAERSPNGPELFAAEKNAKEARKGIWKDWDPSQDEEVEEAAPAQAVEDTNGLPNESNPEYKEVMVTHVDPKTLRMKIQVVGTGTGALDEMMNRFRSFHLSGNTPLSNDPKAGDWVSAKFSQDGQWYRARIRRNDREKKEAEIVFIDYGNEEKQPWKALRPLPAQYDAKTLKPQAIDAQLAYLQFPANKEYLDEAVAFLYETLGDRPVIASVNANDKDGTMHVTLMEKSLEVDKTDSYNARIISEGLATVTRKLRPWEKTFPKVLEDMKRREEVAKQARRGVWEYGDITED